MASTKAQKAPPGGRKRSRHAVSVPDAIHLRLKGLCDRQGRKIQWITEQALTEYLDREEGTADE